VSNICLTKPPPPWPWRHSLFHYELRREGDNGVVGRLQNAGIDIIEYQRRWDTLRNIPVEYGFDVMKPQQYVPFF
jgi:hypothetical protein